MCVNVRAYRAERQHGENAQKKTARSQIAVFVCHESVSISGGVPVIAEEVDCICYAWLITNGLVREGCF